MQVQILLANLAHMIHTNSEKHWSKLKRLKTIAPQKLPKCSYFYQAIYKQKLTLQE
jgi:hypothetical protein